MQTNEDFHVEYNVELFAILFFCTGSYIMMGGKKINILKECETIVNKIIEQFDKN